MGVGGVGEWGVSVCFALSLPSAPSPPARCFPTTPLSLHSDTGLAQMQLLFKMPTFICDTWGLTATLNIS